MVLKEKAPISQTVDFNQDIEAETFGGEGEPLFEVIFTLSLPLIRHFFLTLCVKWQEEPERLRAGAEYT